MSGGGGSSAPSAPRFDFARAKEIIDKAYENQQLATAALEKRAAPYEEKRELSQAELGKLTTGRTGPEAVAAYEKRFGEVIPSVTKEFEAKQRGFQPGLLNMADPTSSASLLANALRGSAQEYGSAMNQASGRASSRLYEAMAAPVLGFEQIANRPSLNKLYDPTYMELAKKPPTVASDVESMKQLYTYNV